MSSTSFMWMLLWWSLYVVKSMEEDVQLDEGFGKERSESCPGRFHILNVTFSMSMTDLVEISSEYQSVFRHWFMI